MYDSKNIDNIKICTVQKRIITDTLISIKRLKKIGRIINNNFIFQQFRDWLLFKPASTELIINEYEVKKIILYTKLCSIKLICIKIFSFLYLRYLRKGTFFSLLRGKYTVLETTSRGIQLTAPSKMIRRLIRRLARIYHYKTRF